MNNEDKILEILGQMQGQIGQMQGQIGQMQEQIGQMQGQIGQMQGDISGLKLGQANLEQSVKIVRESQIRFELEQMPRIGVALDGVCSGLDSNKELSLRVSMLERTVERVDCDVFALKAKNM